MQLTGLHHVTAITARAAENVQFYTQVLGMRLVKKSVNQDDVSAYHLFYADAAGSPGTDVTFFDWPMTGKNRNGAGSIGRIELRIESPEHFDWWAERLASAGVPRPERVDEGGTARLLFTDLEGQALALVSDGGAPGGLPWNRSPVPAASAIRGLSAVRLLVRDLEPTSRLLMEVLGFRSAGSFASLENPRRQVAIFETGPGGAGAQVHVEAGRDLMPARQGWGGVHHVAFRTPDDAEHVAWRKKLLSAGVGVTPVIDRFWFKSIYFREPGGILFEIATDGPGFAADEDPAHLGEKLVLPPFLEGHRQQIEAGLRPLVVERPV
jgi:glyoxalase family protein